MHHCALSVAVLGAKLLMVGPPLAPVYWSCGEHGWVSRQILPATWKHEIRTWSYLPLRVLGRLSSIYEPRYSRFPRWYKQAISGLRHQYSHRRHMVSWVKVRRTCFARLTIVLNSGGLLDASDVINSLRKKGSSRAHYSSKIFYTCLCDENSRCCICEHNQ